MKRKVEDRVEMMKFPCRYPDKPKTSENCVPCLMGDLFAMNYTNMMSLKQQQGMNEEIMTFLRNMTSDGYDNFK